MKTKIILYLLLCYFHPTIYSQSDTLQDELLPPEYLLFAALDTFYHHQRTAQLAEYQITEKNKWLKYIPAIGVGYTIGIDNEGNLKNQLRPSVSFSTNTIYQVFQDKELRKAKIKNIEQINFLELQSEKAKLSQLLQTYQLLVQDYQFLKELHEIDAQLFEIATVQFTNAELAPSVYLPKKRAFLQEGYEIFKKEQELEEMRMEILRVARY